MLFSRKQALAALVLGSVATQAAFALEDHTKAALAALGAVGGTLYVLHHKADAKKEKGLHTRALDAASHYGNKVVNFFWDNHRVLAAAGVAGLVAGVVAVHGRESHHIRLVHQLRHLLSKHEAKP